MNERLGIRYGLRPNFRIGPGCLKALLYNRLTLIFPVEKEAVRGATTLGFMASFGNCFDSVHFVGLAVKQILYSLV